MRNRCFGLWRIVHTPAQSCCPDAGGSLHGGLYPLLRLWVIYTQVVKTVECDVQSQTVVNLSITTGNAVQVSADQRGL